ncbi:MAG: hypothetical protein K6G56_00850 [Clostridiales bacterium]|nr:hypothetical protein [Clostridiales bacterium]
MKKRTNRWLLPTVLVLFILEVITLPLVVMLTYAGRAESPQHLLTFANKKLTWDENTTVHEDGIAELSFFSQYYQNVESQNEDNVFAPGTELPTVIRLKNDSGDTIKYTAFAWMIKECDILELYGDFKADGSSPATNYEHLLPEGVTPDDLIGARAVTGTVDPKAIQDFDIGWYWIFERGDEIEPGIYESDPIDTYLGNKAAWDTADDALIGFYIIIEGDEGPIPPGPPQTGAATMLQWGLVLIGISAIVLVFAIITRVRDNRREREQEGA